MATKLKIGPDDHGKRFTVEKRQSADYVEGYRYEIIDGRLYVSPLPNLPPKRVETWLFVKLELYKMARPDVVNHVEPGARVFVPGESEETVPEPDVAAYHDFPLHLHSSQVPWEDVSPILVAEVMSSKEDAEKDLIRNPPLYRRVRSIREYWVLDPQLDSEQPSLTVFRRQGRRWERLPDVPGGGTYATPLLPGFTLTLNTRG
jgi:Uma2 family endonuclease